jgi:hypothetical protein
VKSTFAVNLRLSHKTLATLLDFYEEKGLLEIKVASLCRMALEDFAKILIKQKLAKSYNMEEALEITSKMVFQKSKKEELRKAIIEEVTIQREVEQASWDIDSIKRKFQEDISKDDLPGAVKKNGPFPL